MTRGSRWAMHAMGVTGILFGLLTIASGGLALFGGAQERVAVGDAVPFVLWFNFGAGFAYVCAGGGLLMRRRWGSRLSAAIALATIGVFAALGAHITLGGAYELRTVGAMILRSLVWSGIAVLAARNFSRRQPSSDRAGA